MNTALQCSKKDDIEN